MKTILLIIITFFAIQNPSYCHAHEGSKTEHPLAIIITTSFDQPNESSKFNGSIDIFQTYSNYQITINSSKVNFTNLDPTMRRKIPVPSEISYLKINYSVDGKFSSYYLNPTRIYRVEAGDVFECKFFRDSLVFYGPDAAKMNIQSKIFDVPSRTHSKKQLSQSDPAYFDTEISKYEGKFQDQIALLALYKNELSVELYDYLYFQCLGLKNYHCVSLITVSRALGPDLGARAVDYYNQKLKHTIIRYPDAANEASYFTDFLFRKEKMEYEIEFNKDGFNKTGANRLLDRISYGYKGLTREKLLITAMIDLPKSYNDADTYLEQMNSLISKHSPYQGILEQIRLAFTPNTKAYNFSLLDSNGRSNRLSDFKGKVVLIDFWFTGCRGCAILNKMMTPVFDHFKSNKKVVFISVSIDPNREIWLKSLKEEVYTHTNSINLLSDKDKQLIKYYNITTYPTLLLINSVGKLITTKPPFPTDEAAQADLIRLIEMGVSEIKD